jgi:hypothetical protein
LVSSEISTPHEKSLVSSSPFQPLQLQAELDFRSWPENFFLVVTHLR